VKKRLTRLTAVLALAALAGLGVTAFDDIAVATKTDTGWGAPDTTGTAGVTVDLDGTVTVDVTLGDSGWG